KGGLSSPLEALQGQVAGVMITRGSSAPGDESWSMNLRGSSSVNTVEPLIIIDGVAANSVSEMRNLNPNDIETINFLKDGSAAIYGSRAAGGVVLITTKKGASGRVKVEYGASATLKTVGLQPTMMTLDEWADGVMTALRNDGNESNVWYTYAELAKLYKGRYIDLSESANPFGTAAFTDVADFAFSDADWLGELFGSTWSTEHQVSVSGGNDRGSYRISLGYNYDGSTLQYGDNNNQRYNFRLNNTYKFTDKLSLESSLSYSRQEQVVPTMISSALTNTMPMPGLPFTTMDGKPYAWGTWGSPVAKVQQGGDNRLTVSSINISETLNYEINSWLSAHANVGYNTSSAWRNTVQNSIQYYNITGTTPTLKDPVQANSTYTQTNSRTDFYSFSGYLNGHKTFGDHNLSLTLGAQYEFKEYTYFGAKVKDIQDGLEIINGAGEVTLTGSEDRYQNSIMSYFGRFNYDYQGRYLFEFNGRYDGSSKFLPENRWDFFWGTSVGWRISEEQFMKQFGWLTNLKLRASYAQMGNQSGISNYDGVQLYGLQTGTGAYVGSDKLSYIATSGVLASKSRSWERIKNYNVALDFGVSFGQAGNLNGTVEYFQKRNDNMLVAITFPATLGDKAPSANAGKFKDWGWEGQATWNGRIGKDWEYHVGGTITFARNELTDYGATTVLTSGYRSTTQGYPLKSIFGLRYGGKIQDEQTLQAYMNKYYENNGIGMPSNLRVGDNMYCDENGDGRLDENDYIYLGSDDPEISYSFNAGASYKGFDLNVVFQGAANRFVWRDINNFTVPMRANYTNTTNASIGNTWTPENRDAYYAPYTNDGNINNYNYQANSMTSQDARYLRLKNITLGYTFPQSLLKPTKVLQGVRLYVTGTDLWETTRIKDGWDPEARRDASGTGRYPFTRNFTFGANFTF
ncbi:MAG: SusC/RagA family TonB-linked outer membrane protein, partial [Prevotella sp.]|nr:SusC/RagA family TonB-linked outer membrane protein [Prevotella sp.]